MEREKFVSNPSGYPGVTWHASSKQWQARLRFPNGRVAHLGIRKDVGDAIVLRKQAELLYKVGGYSEIASLPKKSKKLSRNHEQTRIRQVIEILAQREGKIEQAGSLGNDEVYGHYCKLKKTGLMLEEILYGGEIK